MFPPENCWTPVLGPRRLEPIGHKDRFLGEREHTRWLDWGIRVDPWSTNGCFSKQILTVLRNVWSELDLWISPQPCECVSSSRFDEKSSSHLENYSGQRNEPRAGKRVDDRYSSALDQPVNGRRWSLLQFDPIPHSRWPKRVFLIVDSSFSEPCSYANVLYGCQILWTNRTGDFHSEWWFTLRGKNTAVEMVSSQIDHYLLNR